MRHIMQFPFNKHLNQACLLFWVFAHPQIGTEMPSFFLQKVAAQKKNSEKIFTSIVSIIRNITQPQNTLKVLSAGVGGNGYWEYFPHLVDIEAIWQSS